MSKDWLLEHRTGYPQQLSGHLASWSIDIPGSSHQINCERIRDPSVSFVVLIADVGPRTSTAKVAVSALLKTCFSKQIPSIKVYKIGLRPASMGSEEGYS
jgi:hypothetical protein